MSRIINVTQENFEEVVLKSNVPVLVDFWATWCAPCKMIAPMLEEISTQREDLVIVKVNIDENTELPSRFGVRGIPTCLVFKNGEVEGTKVGAVTRQQMDAFLSNALS
jgi:thioredoxin 1